MTVSAPDWTTRVGRMLQQLADLLAEDEPDRHFEGGKTGLSTGNESRRILRA